MGETYYPGDLFDESWYCTRHGCYPRREVDDKCVVCAWEEQEAARIESLWSNLAKDLWERAKKRWKKDHFEFKISEEWTLKVEDVAKVIPADRNCPILGIPLLIAGGLEPVFRGQSRTQYGVGDFGVGAGTTHPRLTRSFHTKDT